jgi:streptogramin lyase
MTNTQSWLVNHVRSTVMSDQVGARVPRWIGTVAIAAMASTAIVFTPLAAGAATAIAEFPTTAGSTPQGITAGLDGNLWFAESMGGNLIGRITPAGTITDFTGLTGAPFWIASGPGGTLWVTEPSANAIGKLSTAGAVVGEFPVPTAGSFPDQITPGRDGNLWFTEFFGNKIGMITPAGVITEFPISAGAGPTAIVAGSDGNLWFTEQSGNRIGRITTAGVATDFGPVGSTPAGMAAGPDGNVWFTEYSGNQIGRITMAGVVTEYAVTTAASAPASITAGADGNLWFTEDAGNKIGRMSPAGTMLAEFAIPAAGSGPNGIASGPDGNLWFTERLMNQIGRLTPGAPAPPPAAAPTALTYAGATTGGFNTPTTVSATLVDTSTTTATPLSGQSIAFKLNGAETCTGVTDAQGHASCQLTPAEKSGVYVVAANFAGGSSLKASSTSHSFAVTILPSKLALVARPHIANGSKVSLIAVLTDGTRPIAGRTVTLGLGTGATTQQCTATTTPAGSATCTIAIVNQPHGKGRLFATFAGDGYYAPSSASATDVVSGNARHGKKLECDHECEHEGDD